MNKRFFELWILKKAWMIAYRHEKWKLHNQLKDLYCELEKIGW